MTKITANISQHELNCKCKDPECNVTILANEPIIKIVQGACDHFKREYKAKRVVLLITSGARCYVYNRLPIDQGGAGSTDNGQHPRACAIDFKIFIDGVQIPPDLIYDYLDKENPNTLGLGLYKSFNHADGRAIKGRWQIT